MWKRLNSNQMCEKFSYREVFLIKRFIIERFYCIYICILLFVLIKCNISLIYFKNKNLANNSLIFHIYLFLVFFMFIINMCI